MPFDPLNYEGLDRIQHLEKYVKSHDDTLLGGAITSPSQPNSTFFIESTTGDLVFTTNGVERGRIKNDGTPQGMFIDPAMVASIEEHCTSGYLPSPGTAYANYPIFVAPYKCKIAAFWLTPTAAVAQSDSAYWNVRLLQRPGKFTGPPSFIPTGSPATADGYYKTMILAEAGLLGYWMLNETAGTTATDSSTGAHNGTYQGQTVTVTIASPGVFTTVAAHGLASGDQVTFSTTGALPTGLTAGTTYFVIATGLTATSFQVSTTLGGAAVNTSGTQSGTHQVVQLKYQGVRGVPGVTDGNNAELALQSDGSFASVVTGAFTMPWLAGGCYECWVFLASGSWDTTRRTIIGGENGASTPMLTIFGGTATNGTVNNGVGIAIPGTNIVMTDSTFPGLEPGQWHHIVYNRTSGAAGDNTHQIWVDGVQQNLTSTGIGPATTAFASTSTAHSIGRRAAASELLPSGSRMAHVAFYNAPLSAAQIARHYAYGYEFFHKTSRTRDGEAFIANQGWSGEAFPLGARQTLAAGDSVFLEMEPFGSPVTPGALTYGLRVEAI